MQLYKQANNQMRLHVPTQPLSFYVKTHPLPFSIMYGHVFTIVSAVTMI